MESPTSSPKRRRTSEEGVGQDEAPRRLMITKMTLENFKSYAGLQEIGDFHHCFSSVVGPNGSGKSNVIDAMLFVFGKRAKQLRLNKIRELIHKSDQCKPSFATVAVYMQEIIDIPENQQGDEENTSTPSNGSNEQLPYRVVPNSEVILSRTAKSDNTSVYKLNGKNTPFNEISTFLKTKGIDLDHNRFLILQGEVELISMMPPKGKNEGDNDGLLEYLEDIIGSHKFVADTLAAEAEVETLTATRQEKLNRVKAVEQETKALESAKEEAQSLLRRERDIRQQQNILHQVQRLRVARGADALEKQKESLEAKLKECQDQSTNATNELEEMKKDLKEQAKEFEKVTAELQKTEEDFTAYERRHIKLQESIKHNTQNVKDTKKKIADQDKKESSSEEKIASAQERIPELEQEIQDLEQSKEDEDAQLKIIEEESRQKTQELRAELEAKSEALQPLRAEKATDQAALETAQTELQLVQNRTTDAQKRLDEATQELNNLDATKKAKENEVSVKTAELREAAEKVQSLEGEEKDLASKEVKLSSQQKSLMAQVEEVKTALHSKGGIKIPSTVKAILKASKNGGPLAKTGILGRLGDLATIEEEYDVAISTACGGFLNHIVVQTTAGAQHCLEFLRKNNLGRANFIPLDKMAKGAHDRPVTTPEQAPRLLDLIQPLKSQNHAGVMAAIFLAVNNTLVAPDLETASRWAYDCGKRWRVVTIDGKLLELAGTMSGGGKEVRKGGMRLRNARLPVANSNDDDGLQESLRQLEGEIVNVQNSSQQIRLRRKEIVEELRKTRRQIKEIERLLPKLKLEIEGSDTTRENLTELIPQLKEQSKLSDEEQARVHSLGEEVKRCKKALEKSEAKSAGLEEEVFKLKKAIIDAGGSKLKKQQAKCDKIVQSIKDANKALSSSKVSISSNEKAIKKAQKAKAEAKKQLRGFEDDLRKAEEEFASLQGDAVAVKEAYEKVKEAFAAKKIEYEDMGQAVEEVKESHAGLKGKEIELAGQIDSANKTLGEHNQRIRHFDTEIKKLLKKARKDEPELWEDDDDQPPAEPAETDGSNADSQDDEQESPEEANGGEGATEVDRDSARLAASYPTFSEDALDRYDVQELKDQIEALEAERNNMAKNANLGAIAEFRKKEADYLAKVAELDEVTEERNKVRRKHEDLRRQRLEMFMDGFSQITLKLKEMYQMITLGGDAELELVDSLDPFSEGIVFSVRPPKKSWKNISNLSGGEKTLSSLALVFALHHYKPTPLYVMDEIDAALDYKNVSIVANYIKERTKNAQFIIISLRNNMFELADRLVGIYKTQNCSKSVAVDPNAFNVESNQNGVSATPALRNRTNSNIAGTSSVKKTLSSALTDSVSTSN